MKQSEIFNVFRVNQWEPEEVVLPPGQARSSALSLDCESRKHGLIGVLIGQTYLIGRNFSRPGWKLDIAGV